MHRTVVFEGIRMSKFRRVFDHWESSKLGSVGGGGVAWHWGTNVPLPVQAILEARQGRTAAHPTGASLAQGVSA